MRYNERELAQLSEQKPDVEGRLNYKRVNTNGQYYQSVYKERWFKLIDNFLFYFRVNDVGKVVEKLPVGVLVLENAKIDTEIEQDSPFSFSISFIGESERKHIFSCMSEEYLNLWITKLNCASYEYLRNQLYLLQSKIYKKTGKDPLLMVPRNPGSMKWAPGEPSPNEIPHKNTSVFYEHTTAVHRSKSSVHVPNKSFKSHLKEQDNSSQAIYKSHSTTNVSKGFALNEDKSFLENSWPNYSNNVVKNNVLQTAQSTFYEYNNDDLFNKGKKMFAKIPSPPPRKKHSPVPSRSNVKLNNVGETNSVFFDDTLKIPPIPPVRRNSPKRNENGNININENKNVVSREKSKKQDEELNLIQF